MSATAKWSLQAVLLYTEGVLIAQYVILIPTRLECDFLTEPVKVKLLFCMQASHHTLKGVIISG